MGTHGGSFAGGFIKAFLAAMQMRLRQRQMDMMEQFYALRMADMRLDMEQKRRLLGLGQEGRDKTSDTIRGIIGKGGVDTSDTGEAKGTMDFGNADKVYKYLVDKGANPEAAKGFVGSMAHESAGFNNGAYNPDDKGSPSGGWGQWHADRYADFTKRAGSDPKKWTAEDNFNMFKHEMEDTDVGKRTMEQLKQGKSIQDGVDTSAKTYEGASLDPRTINWNNRFGLAHAFDNYVSKTAGAEPVAIPARTSEAQRFKPYRVAEAGDTVQPPPVESAAPIPSRSDQFAARTGPEYAAATAPVLPATPNQTITGRTPEMLTPLASGATDTRLQPASVQAMPSAPDYRYGLPAGGRGGGQYQYVVPGGQQAQAQQAPPPPAPVAATTGGGYAPIVQQPAPIQRMGAQNIPLDQTPMPPPRPENFGEQATPSGDIVPSTLPDASGGPSAGGGALWYGYNGASGNDSASASPLDNMYTASEQFASSAGLTDTSGLMSAGQMSDMTDDTAYMWKGGPVIRYRRGGVVRYQDGGDTDSDMLSEYGGTDTSDPMVDMQRMEYMMDAGGGNKVTNNSDLTTSIQQGVQLTPQEEQQLQPPPEPEHGFPGAAQPTGQPPAQPTAAPTDQPDTTAPSAQSDIPPGSVQVAGPGGWGSLKGETQFTMPRVSGSIGLRSPRMGLSMGTGGYHKVTGLGRNGDQSLYVPGYVGSEDFDAKGIAPLHNSDGSPGVWLLNMVDNGIRAVFSGFGFANQGAIPGSQQQAQNLQDFTSNNNPGMPTRDEMRQLGKMYDGLYDPDNKKEDFISAASEIGGAVSMIKYYALTGQLDAASRLSGGVLLYTRMMSMEQGDEAVNALFKGDLKNAVKYLEKSHDWIPDGRDSTGEIIDKDKGIVRATMKDGAGNIIAQQDYLPAAIMEAALGAKNGTSYWTFLRSLAGSNDVIGAHTETQQLLRQIGDNKFVPPGPAAIVGSKPPIPIDNGPPQPAPDTTTQPDTTQPAPDTQPDTTQPAPDTPDQSGQPPAPPIPDRTTGAVGPPTGPTPQQAQPPVQAIPDRGATSNLVAGPGAPSTTAQGPTPSGGSGAVLVAQQQARDQARELTPQAAVNRMMQLGGYDENDPYLQQVYSQIEQQELGPYQKYRDQLVNQFAAIEGAGSGVDKRALGAALNAKIKDFDNAYYKPQVDKLKREYGMISTRLKQAFSVQMAAAKAKEAERQKLETAQRTQDATRVTAQQKKEAALPDTHVQVRAQQGIGPDGGVLTSKADGSVIPGYAQTIAGDLSDKNEDGTYKNPIARSILQGNPWLSSTYDGVHPETVDMTKVGSYMSDGKYKDELYKPTDRRIMDESSRDIVAYNGGAIDFREANDIATGVSTGQYTMRRVEHPKIHSMVLGDINNDDGVPRTDVLIGRGLNDPNPVRVTMPTDSANRLAGLAKKAEAVTIHNRAMSDVRDTTASTYPSAPYVIPQRQQPVQPVPPKSPSGASSSARAAPPQVALPPRPPMIPGTEDVEKIIREHPSAPRTDIIKPPANRTWDQPIQLQ